MLLILFLFLTVSQALCYNEGTFSNQPKLKGRSFHDDLFSIHTERHQFSSGLYIQVEQWQDQDTGHYVYDDQSSAPVSSLQSRQAQERVLTAISNEQDLNNFLESSTKHTIEMELRRNPELLTNPLMQYGFLLGPCAQQYSNLFMEYLPIKELLSLVTRDERYLTNRAVQKQILLAASTSEVAAKLLKLASWEIVALALYKDSSILYSGHV
jgi:hypothetical protein